jgi:1-acyl-sn-glycerol-3-phosphate acyltransferase
MSFTVASDNLTPPTEDRPPVHLRADTLLDRLLAAGLWAAGASWIVPLMGAQIACHRTLGPDRVQWLERLYTRGQVLLTGSRWRAVVDPAIDPARPYMFFQNHVNHLDHCTMYAATPHFKQGVELEEHFRYPVYGAFMRSRGTLPVRRNNPRDYLRLRDDMRAELECGHSLLVFPEGTRSLTGHLGAFQQGVFRIAQDLSAPIVPVTVTGMYRVMRKGSWLIRPGYDVTVYCDAPVVIANKSRSAREQAMHAVREAMQRRLDAYWSSDPGKRFWERG